jgi:hypothetical protein
MKTSLTLALMVFTIFGGAARAEALVPLAAHRAAYEISLAGTDVHQPASGETPVAASGLIAYEFRGSACEGYASNFRQVTQLQRSEGDPYSSDVSSVTFEDGDGKGLKFEIEGHNSANDEPPISGSAARVEGGATTVELMKPSKAKVVLGQDILFPTQHIEHIIAKAKDGGGPMEAKVYDGSDTGQKVFQTLAIIGHQASAPSPDADAAPELAKVRRWPVTVSYFNQADRDAPPEYVLTFDLYENGVSGSLKLDYGGFALNAKLSKLEWLKSAPCGK